MNKRRLAATFIIVGVVAVGYVFVQQFHITGEIARRIPRIILREFHNKYLALHKPDLDRMPNSIQGSKLFMRKLEFRDFEYYHPMINNPYCSDSFFINNATRLVPMVDPNFYLYLQLIAQYFGTRVMYSCFDGTTKKIRGMVEILYIPHEDDATKKGHYEICGLAAPGEWGTGKALEAAALAIEHFFKATQEKELVAYVAPTNSRCHAFLLKCGFEFEQIAQEEHSKNELIFKIKRTNGLVVTQVAHKLLSHQQALKHCSKSLSAEKHQE